MCLVVDLFVYLCISSFGNVAVVIFHLHTTRRGTDVVGAICIVAICIVAQGGSGHRYVIVSISELLRETIVNIKLKMFQCAYSNMKVIKIT